MTPLSISHSTDELIESMVGEFRPTPKLAMTRRLAMGVVAGAFASAILLLSVIGVRPNLVEILNSGNFWGKVAFTVAMAGVSLFVAARLGRPTTGTSIMWILPVPFLLYLPVGIWELSQTDKSQWLSLLFGHGWQQCTWLLLSLSIPTYLGLWWSFRRFAPAHVESAGATAGLAASAVAAVVYCIHCPTDTAIFALVWYTLAFVIAALAGALLSRRTFRW